MCQDFPDLVRRYCPANKLWSGSYFAGAPLGVVHQYIEQQNRPA
jgi:putative transposase